MSASVKAIFLSYASQDTQQARRVCEALREAGLEVWFDRSALRGGDAWDASIRRQIRECALFVPLISTNTDARSEGYFRLEWKLAVERSHLMADDQTFLLPLVIDDTPQDSARVPDRFRERQWMRLGNGRIPPEFVERLGRLLAGAATTPDAAPRSSGEGAPPTPAYQYQPPPSAVAPLAAPGRRDEADSRTAHRLGVCVLPFVNMSGDSEQEYFSDGITEDIITDLSKVSALWVAARNTAFMLKGKHVDVLQVARQLKASHVLEGSVRKAGGRVRITAQLIDGTTGGHVWAERYDRNLDDIFALQDEISQAIVAALKLKLLPEEKKAIERRGTTNPEAYKLYLMARQYSVTGNVGAARSSEAVVRLCQRATEIDPNYARAWALIAGAQSTLQMMQAREGDGGQAAAERALVLDPDLAEAHAVKALILTGDARLDEAQAEVGTALRLDPDSYDVTFAAARLCYAMRNWHDAIAFFEKSAAGTETDFYAAGMLPGCHHALGDSEGARRAAQRALARCERAVALEPDNGSAMSFLVTALATLGELERVKEWIDRALLLDPDNMNMRYNFACTLISLHDYDAGIDLLELNLGKFRAISLNWMRTDVDLDPIRDHPRFKALFAAAEARVAKSS